MTIFIALRLATGTLYISVYALFITDIPLYIVNKMYTVSMNPKTSFMFYSGIKQGKYLIKFFSELCFR